MKTAMAIAVIVVVSGLSGFAVGRFFPAHRYERLENSAFLLDSSTGNICNPWKKYQEQAKLQNEPRSVANMLFGTPEQAKPTGNPAATQEKVTVGDLIPACDE